MSLLLLMGLGAMGWAGYSVVTGKGYYKGCPPDGYDRIENPFNFWAPTIVIFCVGVFALLVSLGMVHLPRR